MSQNIQDWIFQVAAKEKLTIYRSFLVVYVMILTTLVWGSVAIIRNTSGSLWFYGVGVWFGRTAVTILALSLIPGILGRLNIQIKATRVITFYRRQLGITMFLLSFTHGMLVRIVARFALGQYPLSRAPIFEFFGTLALSLLFMLFVTSNDTSVKRLGPWWKRLHRLVYAIVLLIFFHTILQRVSVWSVMIGLITVLEVVSFVYVWIRNSINDEKKDG